MAKRRVPKTNPKPPLLPKWLAAALAFALPKLLGGILFKAGALIAALIGLG